MISIRSFDPFVAIQSYDTTLYSDTFAMVVHTFNEDNLSSVSNIRLVDATATRSARRLRNGHIS
jgi:hypothetical protein